MLSASSILSNTDGKCHQYYGCKKCQALFFTRSDVITHNRDCTGIKVLDSSHLYAYPSSYLKGFVDCILDCAHKDTCPLITRKNSSDLGSGIVTNVISRKGLTIVTSTGPGTSKNVADKASDGESDNESTNSADRDWTICSDDDSYEGLADYDTPCGSSDSGPETLDTKVHAKRTVQTVKEPKAGGAEYGGTASKATPRILGTISARTIKHNTTTPLRSVHTRSGGVVNQRHQTAGSTHQNVKSSSPVTTGTVRTRAAKRQTTRSSESAWAGIQNRELRVVLERLDETLQLPYKIKEGENKGKEAGSLNDENRTPPVVKPAGQLQTNLTKLSRTNSGTKPMPQSAKSIRASKSRPTQNTSEKGTNQALGKPGSVQNKYVKNTKLAPGALGTVTLKAVAVKQNNKVVIQLVPVLIGKPPPAKTQVMPDSDDQSADTKSVPRSTTQLQNACKGNMETRSRAEREMPYQEEPTPQRPNPDEAKWKRIAEEKYRPIRPRPSETLQNVTQATTAAGVTQVMEPRDNNYQQITNLTSYIPSTANSSQANVVPVVDDNTMTSVQTTQCLTKGAVLEAVPVVGCQNGGGILKASVTNQLPENLKYEVPSPMIEESPFENESDGEEVVAESNVLVVRGDDEEEAGDDSMEEGEVDVVIPVAADLARGDHSYDIKVQEAVVNPSVVYRKRKARPPQHCSYCSYCTFNKLRMQSHLRSHQRVEKQPSLKTFRKELMYGSDEKWYGCNKCNHTSRNNGHMRKHIMAHLGVREWECVICGKRGTSQQQIVLHIKWRHKHHMFKDLKDATIKLDIDYAVSMRDFRIPNPKKYPHRGQFNPFSNSQRGTKSKGKTKIEVSTVSITGSRQPDVPFVCHWCGFKSANTRDHEHHQLSHARTRLWQCAVCGQEEASEKKMAEHIKENHPSCSFKDIAVKLGCREEGGLNEPVLAEIEVIEEVSVEEIAANEEAMLIENLLNFTPTSTMPTQAETGQANRAPPQQSHDLLDVGSEQLTHFGTPLSLADDNLGLQDHVQPEDSRVRHYVTVPVEIYGCDQCDFKVQSSIRFKQHLLSHRGVKPWQCTLCEVDASSRTSIVNHVELQHPDAAHKPLAVIRDMTRATDINLDDYRVVCARRRLNKDWKKAV